VGFQTHKEQGEWAELCFVERARQIGLTLVKPYGNSSSYDVGIEHEGRLLRVQIKSTGFSRGGKYLFNLVGAQAHSLQTGFIGLLRPVYHSGGCLVCHSLRCGRTEYECLHSIGSVEGWT
jgi:hypothetical protein